MPVFMHMWVHPSEFGDREQAVIELLKKYPSDVVPSYIKMPENHDAPEGYPSYRWLNYDRPQYTQAKGLDEDVAIPDWDLLDGILADWPDPSYPDLFMWAKPDDGRYRLGQFWFCLFERHWMLEGHDQRPDGLLYRPGVGPQALRGAHRLLPGGHGTNREVNLAPMACWSVTTSEPRPRHSSP